MKRIQNIMNHPIFIHELHSIEQLEENRIYCSHNLEHLLAVARIGWIYALEHNLSLNKELWYSCALLHDIGRGLQYIKKIPHHEAGELLSQQILTQCNFNSEEIQLVLHAISGHRGSLPDAPKTMEELLIWADKKSRNCFLCNAKESCNWPEFKRTTRILI